MRNNTLASLPSELGNLHTLQRLDVSHNKLCTLPTELHMLTNLTVRNGRRVMPAAPRNLHARTQPWRDRRPRHQAMECKDNLYDDIPLEIINAGFKAILAFLRKRQGVRPCGARAREGEQADGRADVAMRPQPAPPRHGRTHARFRIDACFRRARSCPRQCECVGVRAVSTLYRSFACVRACVHVCSLCCAVVLLLFLIHTSHSLSQWCARARARD